jgi:hypothetical protein
MGVTNRCCAGFSVESAGNFAPNPENRSFVNAGVARCSSSLARLFIGQTYIDVTFLTDRLPVGDEKHVASAYAISFGGNAVTAAFCCAKLGVVPNLLTTFADDWLGQMFLDMAAKYAIPIHLRNVSASSLSFIMPKDGMRAIVRCRDDSYLKPFPRLDLTGCRDARRSKIPLRWGWMSND